MSMSKKANNLMDFVFHFMEPAKWSLLSRRIFILTIPISGPIWFLGAAILIAFLLIILMPGMLVYEGLEKMWKASEGETLGPAGKLLDKSPD